MPRPGLAVFAVTPVVAGVVLLGDTTPRPAGLLLLVLFGAFMAVLVRSARQHRFLELDEIEDAARKSRGWLAALGLTVVGIVVISSGGELGAAGAEQMILVLACRQGWSGWW